MNLQRSEIKAFEESEYGNILKGQIRFATFKPTHISNGEWVKLLGIDVHNLRHMCLMQKLCKSFSKHEKTLNNEDLELLEQVALVHDWAEAIIGDIPAPLKTDKDNENEKNYLLSLLIKFQIIQRDKIIKVLFDENDPLHETFSFYEKVGYIRTAFIAWERSKTVTDTPLCENLKKLASSVFQRQIKEIVFTQNHLNLVKKLIQTKQNDILEILAYLYENQLISTQERNEIMGNLNNSHKIITQS